MQLDSTAVSKTSDFGSSPDRSAMALWCKIAAFGNDGNTSGSQQALNTSGSQQALNTSGSQQALILRPQVQFPRGLLMGYSYNGYYARLLICEIRVRIPDDSKTPHRTNRIRWPGFQSGDTGSSPVGVCDVKSLKLTVWRHKTDQTSHSVG